MVIGTINKLVSRLARELDPRHDLDRFPSLQPSSLDNFKAVLPFLAKPVVRGGTVGAAAGAAAGAAIGGLAAYFTGAENIADYVAGSVVYGAVLGYVADSFQFVIHGMYEFGE